MTTMPANAEKSPSPGPALRLLERNGRYRVARKGVRRRYLHDFYHRLLAASWLGLIAYLLGIYIVTNALFAGAYLAIGDGIENARPGSFSDAFFFSVQTMATIGYGKMTPNGLAANTLVTMEALLGLAGIAVATGLLFAKFSRPTARVTFSRRAVVTRRNGKPVFMFRVGNERDSVVVEAHMTVVFSRTERTHEGETIRRFHDMQLDRSHTALFALSWTVIHPIDEQSPLHGATVESLRAGEVEIIVSLTGLEETFAQTIHARFSYIPDDIVFGGRFRDVLYRTADGRRGIDYSLFHEVEEVRGERS